IYAIGAEKDHIVPWSSAWRIAQLTSAKTGFVLARSGHLAGKIKPPSAGKGGYWTDESGDAAAAGTAAAWLAGAKKHEGSWWGDWTKWLEGRSRKRRAAAGVAGAASPPIQDAPGSYVLEK